MLIRRRRVDARGLALAKAHGLFNVVGGAWPIVSLRTFEWVFGKKHEVYLEMTIGGLMISAGLSQMQSHGSREGIDHARRLGLAVATTLLAIDLIYVGGGVVRKTYLIDALFEIGWIAAWQRQRDLE